MYLDYEEFKALIDKVDNGDITYKEAMKYYTLDEDFKLIVLKLDYVDGKYKVSESTKIDYTMVLKKYTTPFEYLLAFLIDGQDEKFVNDFANLVLDTDIIITVMDESTEVITTVKTTTNTDGQVTINEPFEGNPVGSYPVHSTNVTSETTVNKTFTTKIEPTYVKTWFVESYKKYKYKKDDSGPVSQGVTTKTENYNYNSTPISTASGTRTISTETIIQTIRKYFEVASTETSDNTDVIVELFKRSSPAKANIMDDPSWLIDDMLAENENTADMVELTKYWMQKATGYNFGVSEFDFSIYDLGSFSSVSSGGLMSMLKEYCRYWENASGAPMNEDGTMYKIISDGYGHPTVGYGVDIENSGYKSKFIENGYPTTIGGFVPVDFVDAIEDEIMQNNLNVVKSATNGINLTDYQIIALVSRLYNTGPGGVLNTYHSPVGNFAATYNAYWTEADDQFEAKDSNPNLNHMLYTTYLCYPYTSNNVPSDGLKRRRKSEWTLFQTGYFDVLDKWYTPGMGGSIIECAKAIHEYMEQNGYTYCVYGGNSYEECGTYGKSHGLSRNFEDSKTNKNTCCATYVSWVLQEAGYLSTEEHQDGANNLTSLLKSKGWTVITNSSQFEPGDVLTYDHHVEIYAGDGKIYNAGSGRAIRGASPGNMYRTCTQALRAP